MKIFRKALEEVDLIIRGLELIEKLLGKNIPAVDLLSLIRNIVKAIRDRGEGTISVEDVRAGLQKLELQIMQNDTETDQALDDKFPAED